jgi:aconitate hydratase 2/2-methylisocitrate dehydratase
LRGFNPLPAPDAWSRPDIPLHALAMLKNAREGIEPDQPGRLQILKLIALLTLVSKKITRY